MNAPLSHIPPVFDPEHPYHLSEEQHYRVYQARHLVELLHSLSSAKQEFFDIRSESLAVTCSLIGELLDEAVPKLIFKDGKGEKL
jgi:hypothetical protein